MKRFALFVFAAVMMLAALSFAESPDLFALLNGKVFEFSSGAGAWGTELTVGENGTFAGTYHDSEMGETGEGYPNGTVYGCSFHGQLSDPVMVDAYTWTARIAAEPDEGQVPEAIDDEIRYVTTAPYGLEHAETVTVYLPGAPVNTLPEAFMFWSHLQEIDPDADHLPYYAIWNAADEAGFITYPEADAGEGQRSAIQGSFQDGCYVLTVPQSGAGEWRADEMAQDPSVVKLAEASEADGVYTARYEPAGDGEATVSLRHFSVFGVCDELHTFDLLVSGGQITEVTGGSYTASPDEADLDPSFSGEWLEKDTQFTALNVSKNEEGGWNVAISSPMTHGAWIIRATAYYDCEENAFVYANGVKNDLTPETESGEAEAAGNLWGTLRFAVDGENLLLEWYGMEASDNQIVLFEKQPGLPPYAYPGDDPIEGAIANSLAGGEEAGNYLTAPGYVTIPCVIIHKTEMIDDAHAKVYGSFWILNYVKKGDVLENISGGEYPAVATLEKANDEWTLTSMEVAGDGDDYAADIRRFANGDKELEEKYFSGADLLSAENQAIRTRQIKAYVEANGLAITAYQDYGWDPVSLD